MRFRLNYLFCVLLCLFFNCESLLWAQTATAAPQIALIRRAIDGALSNHPLIQVARAREAQAEFELSSMQKKLLPTLSWDASYRNVDELAQFRIPALNQTMEMGLRDTVDTGLNLRYVLFNGFVKENTVDVLTLQKQYCTLEVQKTQKMVAKQTALTWKAIESAALQHELVSTGVERVQTRTKQMAALVDQGMKLELDLMTLQLTQMQYEQMKSELEIQMANLHLQLQLLTGKEWQIPTPHQAIASVTFKALDLDQKESILQFSIEQQIMEKQKQISGGRHFPEIGLFAGYRNGKPGLNPFGDAWMDYYQWGCKINWDVWDWGARGDEAKAKTMAEISIEQRRLDAQNQLQLAFQQAVKQYEIMARQMAVRFRAAQLAEKRLTMMQSQLDQNMISVMDYAVAEKEYVTVVLEYYKHCNEMYRQAIEIDELSGRPISEWRLEP